MGTKKFLTFSLALSAALSAFAIQRVYVIGEGYDTATEIPADYTAQYYDELNSSKTVFELTPEEWFYGPTALASWGGARSKLSENGIVPAVGYLGNFAANPAGGRSRGATNSSSVHLGVGVDLEKLTGLEELSNWSIGNVWVWRFGESLTKEYIGNTFNVQQNYGSQTIQLQSLFALYNKAETLGGDFDITFKFGRFAAGDNFMSKPIYWLYQNNAFDGNPVGVFNQTKLSAYPGSTWAAFSQLKHKDGQYFKAGVYQINNERADNMHGLDWSFKDSLGANANIEIGWDINHDDSAKNPANISAGLVSEWYSVAYIDGSGRTKSFNYSVYVQADYMIWNMGYVKDETPYYITRKNDKYRDLRGLVLWGVFQYDPDYEVARIPVFANGGLLFNAPFASRPDDVICFGIAYGKYSDRYVGVKSNSYEIAVELNYKVQINRFMFVQPNVQAVFNPEGGEYSDALVLGIQYGIAL